MGAANPGHIGPRCLARIAHLDQQAARLCALGAHEYAEPLLEQALALATSALGHDDVGTATCLDGLARSRLHGGRLDAALADYRRLLALVEPSLGTAHPLVCRTRGAIERCVQGLRARSETARLQAQLTPVLLRARSQRAVDETGHQERMRTLARRLIARGHVSAGARLLEDWLTLLVRDAHPIDAESRAEIRDHALALWNCGELNGACRVLAVLVQVQQQSATDAPGLRQALSDWGACLAAQGQRRSARETAVLATAIGST
jgi:tetratricopeptide (TPR) repeat protein